MTKLEEALAKLGRQSWTGINLIGKSEDWMLPGFEEHIKTCPIWPLYEELVRTACEVKAEWLKTSKSAKEMLFAAAMSEKQESTGI